MRIRPARAVIAGTLLLMIALFGVLRWGPSSAHAITNCDTIEAALNAEEQAMLTGINAERAAAGLAPLVSSPGLNRAAAWKSADSSANGPAFSHRDSLGRWPSVRAPDCGYPGNAAENIAYGYVSAADTLAAWMASPGHRANIFNAGYRVVGIGEHGTAWTTDFGFIDDSDTATAPPVAPRATTVAAVATAPPAPAAAVPAVPTAPATAVPSPTPAQAAPRVAGVHLELSAGLNLVTYVGPALPVADALASLSGHVDGVYEWNSDLQQWERYLPGGPDYVDTFSRFSPGHVYALQLSASGTWLY